MAKYIIAATLTTAGAAAIAGAVSTNSKLKITAINFGAATAAVSATTTDMGTVLALGIGAICGSDLAKKRFEGQTSFRGGPSAQSGTVGVYADTTLIAVARFTLPAATAGNVSAIVRFDTPNADVFNRHPRTSIGASAMGELWRTSQTSLNKFIPQDGVQTRSVIVGDGVSNLSAMFANPVPLLETAVVIAYFRATKGFVGSFYYDLRDRQRYVFDADFGWNPQGAGFASQVKPGVFYYSTLTRKLYYARNKNDFLLVNNPQPILVYQTLATQDGAGNPDFNGAIYDLINPGSVIVAAGDTLRYDVTGITTSAQQLISTGIDAFVSDPGAEKGELLRHSTVVDQNGLSVHGSQEITTHAKGKWYSRVFDLTPVAGKALANWAVSNESENLGDHISFYRNVRVVDASGAVKFEVFTNQLLVPGESPWAGGSDIRTHQFLRKDIASFEDLFGIPA